MKRFSFILVIALIIGKLSFAQNVGINSTGATPDASAMLDISASDKGLLIPRVALTATNVAGPIGAPVTSLLVYNTATAGSSPNNVVPGYYYWNGTSWVAFSNASNDSWTLTGNSGLDPAVNFIGTTDDVDFVVRANGAESVRFVSGGGVEIDAGTAANSAIYASGSINDYLELNVQNLSNGTLASSDLVATANNGTGSSVYVDLGINSQAYSNGASNILNGPNLAYLYAHGRDFKIGNGTPGKNLVLFTNPTSGTLGTNTANGVERMRVSENGNIGIGTNSPVSTLDVNGTVSLSIITSASSVTLDDTHYTVILTGGNPSVTLPSASSSNEGRVYVIVNHLGTARTISAYKDFTGSSITAIAANSSITIQSDGSSWYRIK